MEIIEENQGGINIYKLNGHLDSNTSSGFENKIIQAIDNGSKSMIIDFKNLDYISSAGLRVILKATKVLRREDGKIMLCDMQDYVKEVFEISGFDSFMPIVGSMGDALDAFSPHRGPTDKIKRDYESVGKVIRTEPPKK
jgi:anti-sigma B factor antagonist